MAWSCTDSVTNPLLAQPGSTRTYVVGCGGMPTTDRRIRRSPCGAAMALMAADDMLTQLGCRGKRRHAHPRPAFAPRPPARGPGDRTRDHPALPVRALLHSRRSNCEAASIIRSAGEEMPHMILVANVMVAGRKPVLAKPGFISFIPACCRTRNDLFCVELLPLEPALDIFKIERPAKVGAPPQSDVGTIGQFYEAIEEALMRLTNELGPSKVFTGKRLTRSPPGRCTWRRRRGGARHRSRIGLLRALKEVTDEGEGLNHTIWDGDKSQELAHYFRFAELRAQRRYPPEDTEASGPSGPELPVDFDAVAPMRPNLRERRLPRPSGYSSADDQRQIDSIRVCCSSCRPRSPGPPTRCATRCPSWPSSVTVPRR